MQTCLAAAGTSETKKRDCMDNDFLFGYQVGQAGIDVRYKYYAYRWDFTYAPQMHHKFMAVDGKTLYSGSYNLSDNAEHGTFENMMVLKGAEHAALIQAFEANFESIWKTGRDENKLASLNARIDRAARSRSSSTRWPSRGPRSRRSSRRSAASARPSTRRLPQQRRSGTPFCQP